MGGGLTEKIPLRYLENYNLSKYPQKQENVNLIKTSRERPKSAPYLRLNKFCEILGKIDCCYTRNENVISEL